MLDWTIILSTLIGCIGAIWLFGFIILFYTADNNEEPFSDESIKRQLSIFFLLLPAWPCFLAQFINDTWKAAHEIRTIDELQRNPDIDPDLIDALRDVVGDTEYAETLKTLSDHQLSQLVLNEIWAELNLGSHEELIACEIIERLKSQETAT